MGRIKNNLLLSILVLFQLSGMGYGGASDYVVVGYYPSYRYNTLPAKKLQLQHLTHIMHSFVYPDETGNIFHSPDFIYPDLIQRVHEEGKEIYIALGGGAQSGPFSAMAADSTARANFVSNVIEFCTIQGYDGIDIDWEHPSSAADKANMNKLVYDFKQAAPQLGITVTLPGSDWVGQYIDYTYLTPLVEWFNIMSYDMYGPWSATSGHHSPIYAPGSQGSAEQNMNYLINTRSIPPSKLVLGLPFYGHLFNSSSLGGSNSDGSSLGYSEIMLKINDGWDYYWDDLAKSPYLVNELNTQIISYNNIKTISLKCDYAKSAISAV